MAQRVRPGLMAEQKREMWSRWKAGQSLSEIGRALGRERSSIHRMVASTGGYMPTPRRRSPRVLSSAEREEISRGLAEGVSLRTIATRSDRAASTISREIARHGGRLRYRATQADERAWQRARRPKRCKLATSAELRDLVAGKLALDWSPQTDLGLACPDLSRGAASTGVDRDDLPEPLRPGPRGPAQGAHGPSPHPPLRPPLAPRHHERPGPGRDHRRDLDPGAPGRGDDRAVPGHWEGDLLAGSARIAGLSTPRAALRIAWICSILFTLNAGRA
jgi:Helix-turn-helix domain